MSDPITQGTETPRGINAPGVSAWFADHVAGVDLPLSFTLVAGGRSNLTYLVTDAGGTRYVLRRPPTGHLLPTAHDMSREHRIISAMGPAGVPVPPALGLCQDDSVNGAPFYVMGFVDGVIARNEDDVAAHFDEDARRRCGLALIDTLAQIHTVDPDAAGLGDLARKEGYIARQLKRWYANYQAANQARGGTPLPAMEQIHQRLSDTIPEQGPAAVVHGDYRLDNCILAADGSRVLAVLDWELCTLGDPLADVGQFLVYWPEAGERSALGHAPTTMPGFAGRTELIDRYAAATGRDLADLGFYVAFAYWKLAAILEGVYARYVGGAMGDDGFDVSSYPDSIAWLANQATGAADNLGA
ncbi:MAG TPA: phosphotransferase family protein [Acidimicrobiales bacterium]|nr:phosphotransferase family protein [Acidimicrobiales bacterium]